MTQSLDMFYLSYLAWAECTSLYVKPSLWPGTETNTDDPEATQVDGE